MTPQTPAVPTGTVVFSFTGGATVASVTATVDATGKATSAAVVLPPPATGSSSYVITATYSGDVNYKTSSQTAPVAVVASPASPIVPGTNTSVTATVAYPGGSSPTITITGYSSTNPPPAGMITCVVVSPLGN